MPSNRLNELIGIVAASDAAADARGRARRSPACLSMSRLDALARRTATPSPSDLSHVLGCRLCAGRLRAFRAVATSRRAGLRHRLRFVPALATGVAAALVWLVASVPAPREFTPVIRGLVHAGASSSAAALVAPALPAYCMPCDCNCDGKVNLLDAEAFVLALTNPAQFAHEYPDCDRFCPSDVNCDDKLDGQDVDPFLACLTRG
ncbi:MAG: hypothetical protein AB7Q17_02210 [Phycisphaerae bacterium]